MILIFLLNIFENFLFPDFSINASKFNPARFLDQNFLISFGGTEKFGLSDMRIYNAELQIRPFRLKLKTFGNEFYRENTLELSGGFFIYKTLTGGLGIELLNNWIKEYVNRYTYSIRFGIAWHLSDFNLDLCLNNINFPKFSEVDNLPPGYILGVDYNFKPIFKPYFYLLGSTFNRPFFRTGAFIRPSTMFEFAGGLNTENFAFEYSLRIHLGRIFIDYAGTNHHQLGLTHAFFINILRP